jgi:hypothetical protein
VGKQLTIYRGQRRQNDGGASAKIAPTALWYTDSQIDSLPINKDLIGKRELLSDCYWKQRYCVSLLALSEYIRCMYWLRFPKIPLFSTDKRCCEQSLLQGDIETRREKVKKLAGDFSSRSPCYDRNISGYFQHLNHVFKDISTQLYGVPSLFPSMWLDWTENLEIAKRFAGDGGVVLSLDIDRLAPRIWTFIDKYTGEIEPGNPMYYGYTNRDARNNVLMREQKGYLVFWPFYSITIEQLKDDSHGDKELRHILKIYNDQ